MALKSHNRFELARNQLIGAIALFIRGGDRFSAITLAGAADVILSRLIISRGGENFTDYSMKIAASKGEKSTTREIHGKALNDQLLINDLKHLDDGDDVFLDVDDLEECTLAAILKALANYATLNGPQDDLVLGFRVWVKQNLDPAKYNVDCVPDWKPSEQ